MLTLLQKSDRLILFTLKCTGKKKKKKKCLTVAVSVRKGLFYKCLHIFFSPTCFVHMYLFIMLLLQEKKQTKNSMY